MSENIMLRGGQSIKYEATTTIFLLGPREFKRKQRRKKLERIFKGEVGEGDRA